MAIDKLYIENFKGIKTGQWIDIKPITVFIGANSSGKSSCIHALACLSQTLKVPNNSTPIVLDDEYANVHLGRFIEVIHSKSYQDLMSLGVSLKNQPYIELDEDRSVTEKTGDIEAIYRFKCSQRTQDIRIENAQFSVGKHIYLAKFVAGKYTLTYKNESTKVGVSLKAGFLFDPEENMYRSGVDFKDFVPFFNMQGRIAEGLRNSFYLGPFRDSPRRKYETRGANPTEVGTMGEAAITMLANESIQTQKRPHMHQVANWLKQMGLAQTMKINRVGQSDLVGIKLGLKDGEAFPIADLGYGLSQIMPVLTQCSFAQSNSTLLFEQPEIHLHTKSSRELASVFIDTAINKQANIVLETHSPDLVKQFFIELRNGTFNKDDFVLYKVIRKGKETCIKEIKVDAENDFDVYENWESGISI